MKPLIITNFYKDLLKGTVAWRGRYKGHLVGDFYFEDLTKDECNKRRCINFLKQFLIV